MALLNSKVLSIKWKLSIALLGTGLSFVLAYVWIAKRVFEADKISYVFEAQGALLESTKQEIETSFEKALLVSRSAIATFDPNRGKLSEAGEQIFFDENVIAGIELWNENTQQVVFRLEKRDVVIPPVISPQDIEKYKALDLGRMDVEVLPSGNFQLVLRYKQDAENLFRMRAIITLEEPLPKATLSQSFSLIHEGRVLLTSDVNGTDETIFELIAKDLGSAELDQTKLWTFENLRMLVTVKSLSISKLKVLVATPEAEALGALGTLFNRSILFLFFSTFCLILISLGLAKSLTSALTILTAAAFEIGRGNFKAELPIKSRDEMGVLAQAFKKMATEIERLLVETREKARMEEELRTASLVQENLIPSRESAHFKDFEVNGLILNSSECGGDWWHYFERGDHLYVAIADATGHGTPAALITAAARSVFSRLEKEDLGLQDMMRAWDQAVLTCSRNQIFMTGALCQINISTGQVALINAAHEAPLIIKQMLEEKFEVKSLDLPPSRRIGDTSSRQAKEFTFQLEPNDSIILYTDGLFAIEPTTGGRLNERRLIKLLAAKAELNPSAAKLTASILSAFNDYRENASLPDDVSIVAIHRKGTVRTTVLTNESGDLQQI